MRNRIMRRMFSYICVITVLTSSLSLNAFADDLNVDGEGGCPEYTFTDEAEGSFENVNVSNDGVLHVESGTIEAETVSLSNGASITVDKVANFYNDDMDKSPDFEASDASIDNSGDLRVTDASVSNSEIDNTGEMYFYYDTEISESEINNSTENSELFFSYKYGEDGSGYTTSVIDSTINNEGTLYFYTKADFTDSTLNNEGYLSTKESATFKDSTLNNNGDIESFNVTFTGDSQVQNDEIILGAVWDSEEPEHTNIVIGGNTHLINGSADNSEALIQSALSVHKFYEADEYEPFGDGQTVIKDKAVVDNHGQLSSGYEITFGDFLEDSDVMSVIEGKILISDEAVLNNKETGLIDNGGLLAYYEIYGERAEEFGLSENTLTNVELEGGTLNNEGIIDIAFDSAHEERLDKYNITHGTLSVSGGTLNNMDGGTVQTDTIIMTDGKIDNSGSITTDTLDITGGTLINNEAGTVSVLNGNVTIEKGSDSESDVVEGGFLHNVGTLVIDTVTYYGLSLVKGLDDTDNVIIKQIEKAAEFIFTNCFSLDGFNLIGFQSSEDAGVVKNVGETIEVNSVSKWIALWESAKPESDDTHDQSSDTSGIPTQSSDTSGVSGENKDAIADRVFPATTDTTYTVIDIEKKEDALKSQTGSGKIALFSTDELIKANLNSKSGETVELFAKNTDEDSMVAITDKDTIVVKNRNEVVNESMYSISLIDGKMRLFLSPALIKILGIGTHKLTVEVNNMEYQISVTIY